MPPLLEARGLSVIYAGRVALRGVDLALDAGQATALVGASGSGKSTLLHALLGLLPETARVAGELWWRGGPGTARDLLSGGAARRERMWRRLRGRRIALVPQEPAAALDPRRTAAAHLRECLPKSQRGSLEARWKEVGLDPNRGRDYPHQWSGGMQQRLLVAMALAQDPALLLADEPTSALDTLHQSQLLDLLGALRGERGLGLLLVTHDLAVAARVADAAVVLDAGLVVERGRVPQVFLHPKQPETAALVAAQPRTVRADEVQA